MLWLLVKGEGKWLLSKFSSLVLGQSSLYSWWGPGKMAAATWGQHRATGSSQGVCKVISCSPSGDHFLLSHEGGLDFGFLKNSLTPWKMNVDKPALTRSAPLPPTTHSAQGIGQQIDIRIERGLQDCCILALSPSTFSSVIWIKSAKACLSHF